MALTVTPNLDLVTDCQTTTGWDVTKLAGGGGTPSANLDNEIYVQGTGSISLVVNRQRVLALYSTTSRNFNTTHLGDLVYIWVQFTTIGNAKSVANNGLQIVLGDGSNRAYWNVAGSDRLIGGWTRFVIDPTTSPTSGSVNLSSITEIGVCADMGGNTTRTENLFIDRIDIGRGLTLSGVDAELWDSLFDVDNLIANKYGIVRQDNGVSFMLGDLVLGDPSESSDLISRNSIAVWEDPEYWDGSQFISCITPANHFTLRFNGGSSVSTTFNMGDKIGSGDTMGGSNGCTIVSASPNFYIDFTSPDLNGLGLYACQLTGVGVGVTFGTDPAHEVAGTTFTQCGQIDVGAATMRVCTVNGYTGAANGAMLFGANTNVKFTSF
ncbi:MAG: hypothetical protein LPH21_06970, partial [Shewanella sp.]|nr:hypothetical protein [Shewanella sp.]